MNLKTRIWIKGSLLISCAVILIVVFFPFSKTLELKTQDLRSKLSGANTVIAPIVIAAIDDASFEDINIRWPWPREILAEAILKLKASGAKVVGLDIMLGDKGYTAREDLVLAQAIKNAGNVVLPAKYDQKETGGYKIDYFDAPLGLFLQNANSVGYVNLPLDRDGLVRHVITNDQTLGKKETAFGLTVLKAFDEKNASVQQYSSDTRNLRINYSVPGAFPVISFYKILRGEFDPSEFQNKIVLIGAFFKESHDQLLTPFETSSGLYGIEVHANIINTLYGGHYIKTESPFLRLLILLIFAFTASFTFTKIRPIGGLISLVILIPVFFGLSLWLYSAGGFLFNIMNPFLALIFSWIGSVVFNYAIVDKEKRHMRSTFSRYVAPEIVNLILKDNKEVNLGGESREVVIFFSDICGFTPLSEKLTPREVVDMLNRYFTEMTEIIFKHEGTFNKYIGDAIMAFFGAPVTIEKASEKAVRACIEMRTRLAELNGERAIEGKPPISIGIGLHKGEALVGNIGSPRQMEYTIIGDAVNVCSRIEGLTRKLHTDLLISDDIYREVKDIVEVETHEPQMVKGKSEPVIVHSVLRLKE